MRTSTMNSTNNMNNSLSVIASNVGRNIVLPSGLISYLTINEKGSIGSDVYSLNYVSNYAGRFEKGGKVYLKLQNEKLLLIKAMKQAFFVPDGESEKNYQVKRINKSKGFELDNLEVVKVGHCGIAKTKKVCLTKNSKDLPLMFNSVTATAKYLGIDRRRVPEFIRSGKKVKGFSLSYI